METPLYVAFSISHPISTIQLSIRQTMLSVTSFSINYRPTKTQYPSPQISIFSVVATAHLEQHGVYQNQMDKRMDKPHDGNLHENWIINNKND